MADPILDEIWRVREEMVTKHGGLKGYIRYIQELDRDHWKKQRGKTRKKRGERASATRTSKASSTA